MLVAIVKSVLTVVVAIAAVVCLYIFVLPKEKDGNLGNPVLQALHDLFTFKKLYIESITRFLYVLATVFVVVSGFFMLFGRTFVSGLLMMIIRPVIVRISFEFCMLTILLVKNVIEINNKLK